MKTTPAGVSSLIIVALLYGSCTFCSSWKINNQQHEWKSHPSTEDLEGFAHRGLLQQKTPAAAQVCTQTEYFCGAGDVILGDAHNALNQPGNCVFDKGGSHNSTSAFFGRDENDYVEVCPADSHRSPVFSYK